MVGQNISMLMPEPLSSLHDSFLHAYMKSSTSHVVGYTRMVIALHQSGYIFPLCLFVRKVQSTVPPFACA